MMEKGTCFYDKKNVRWVCVDVKPDYAVGQRLDADGIIHEKDFYPDEIALIVK